MSQRKSNLFEVLEADGSEDTEEEISDRKEYSTEPSDSSPQSHDGRSASDGDEVVTPRLVDDLLGDTIELRRLLYVSDSALI